jgi:hypothetical protein
MAHADMTEGVEHVHMGEHAARKRDVMADFIETVRHAGVPELEGDVCFGNDRL